LTVVKGPVLCLVNNFFVMDSPEELSYGGDDILKAGFPEDLQLIDRQESGEVPVEFLGNASELQGQWARSARKTRPTQPAPQADI
jgi:hypothetical protein